MLHLRDMSQYIIGHFKSQQKDTFCQGNIRHDEFFKSKNNQHRYCIRHLELSKKSNITFKRWKLSELWPVQVGENWANAWNSNWANLNFWAIGILFQSPSELYTPYAHQYFFIHLHLVYYILFLIFYCFKSQNKIK